jgi:hypothetical protein
LDRVLDALGARQKHTFKAATTWTPVLRGLEPIRDLLDEVVTVVWCGGLPPRMARGAPEITFTDPDPSVSSTKSTGTSNPIAGPALEDKSADQTP